MGIFGGVGIFRCISRQVVCGDRVDEIWRDVYLTSAMFIRILLLLLYLNVFLLSDNMVCHADCLPYSAQQFPGVDICCSGERRVYGWRKGILEIHHDSILSTTLGDRKRKHRSHKGPYNGLYIECQVNPGKQAFSTPHARRTLSENIPYPPIFHFLQLPDMM